MDAKLKPIQSIADLTPDPNNPNAGTERGVYMVERSLEKLGAGRSILVDANGTVLAGNKTIEAAAALGIPIQVVDSDGSTLVVVRRKDLQLGRDAAARELSIADNRAGEVGLAWDTEALAGYGIALDDWFFPDELAALGQDYHPDGFGGEGEADADEVALPLPAGATTLAERFIVPPFSILDTRQGYWQERKRQWLALGIASELGREAEGINAAGMFAGQVDYAGYRGANRADGAASGTSVFDPVLTELMVRWFSPPGGIILDPFAGGSVRGIVSAWCGRGYVGVDLRAEQVAANQVQADTILGAGDNLAPITDPNVLTPIQTLDGVYFKRDDSFTLNGVRGGKVRSAWQLMAGADGVCTAGSRQSPQVNIIAHLAALKGIPCRLHVPDGPLTPELEQAAAVGGEIVPHRPGYNSVIVARARADAAERGWLNIPFGMECSTAIVANRLQAQNLPYTDMARLVIAVGSGMTLAGVLWGLQDARWDGEVVAVQVGADPTKRLNQYAPPGWAKRVTWVKSPLDYHTPAPACTYGNLNLDPIYEAKLLPYIQAGDCVWVTGVRQGVAPSAIRPTWVTGDSRHLPTLISTPVDFIMTCPPYFDLERYGDDPADLSNAADYGAFLVDYRAILAHSIALLKPNRFAAIVVGDIRDGKAGYYRNFVGDTITAFLDCGMMLYNEAILINPAGTLPIRAGKAFEASRKLGKSHQNVLVFVKGDPRIATQAIGPVEYGAIVEEGEQDGQQES